MRAGVFGIVSNILLGAAKLVAGMLTNSIGIMADAANNISDCGSGFLMIIGMSLADKKPDREHPYGHARYEYLFGFTIGIVMVFMGVMLAVESVQKIITPEVILITPLSYAILGASVLVKLAQMVIYRRKGKVTDSPVLKAGASDSGNDAIATAGILASMVVMDVFDINIDGIVGLAVSVFVIFNSLRTVGSQVAPLIGIKPTKERVKEITDRIMSYPGVLGIHDLVLHNYGVHNDFVTVHVEVDAKRGFLESHELIDNIETDFRDRMGLPITIHMDPVVVGDPKLDDIKAQINRVLSALDPEISAHDIRMIENPSFTKVILDCVVPPEKPYTAQILETLLAAKVVSNTMLQFVVEIDIPFS